MLLLLARFIIVLLVFLGLFQTVYDNCKLDKLFIPFVITMALGLVMFFAGILNIMKEVFILIVILSLFQILTTLFNREKVKFFYSKEFYFFIFISLIFLFIFRNKYFLLYDDFSHWGLVVREIFYSNRLPNFSDEIIMFQSYPTGAATFIYFVVKILGFSEGNVFFAQFIIYLVCIMPLFSFVKNKKLIPVTIISLYSLYLLFGNLGMRTVYVDTLLTCISLAVTAILFSAYKNGDVSVSFIPLILGSTFLVTIKNSGLLFAVFLIIIFMILKTEEKSKWSFKYIAFLAVGPFIISKLWSRHTELVFSEADLSKHSMSMDNYQSMLGAKTYAEIISISESLFKRIFNIQELDIKIILLVVSFLLAHSIFDFYNNNKKNCILTQNNFKLFLTISGMYITYQIGLWFMYIFSMPSSESLYLAGYTRYNVTVISYLLGIVMVFYLSKLNENSSSKLTKIFISVSALMILIYSVYNQKHVISDFIFLKDFEDTPRGELSKIKSGQNFEEEQNIILYVSDLTKDYTKDYLGYQFKYELRNKNIKIVDLESIEIITQSKSEYLLIILEEDELLSSYLKSIDKNNENNIVRMNIGG